jgi:putative SOS response-associated peptidase YedK
MCSRINQQEITAEELMQRYDIDVIDEELQLPFDINIGVGSYALIVVNNHGMHQLVKAIFGFTPAWSKKRTSYFNARIEGSDNNVENNAAYNGPYDIVKSGAFRSAFANRRCIVPVRSFIEGPEKEKLSEPYLVYSTEHPLFSLAGIFEEWTNPETGEVTPTFAVLTRSACASLKKIRHHRMPVPLNTHNELAWIHEHSTDELISYCTQDEISNTWQIQTLNPDLVKSGKLHDAEILKPYIKPPANTLF